MPYLQVPVTLTDDQPDITAAIDSVAVEVGSMMLIAANPDRKGAIITNFSTGDLYVALAETASVEAFTIVLAPNDCYEIPFSYRGVISGIWDDATGAAMVTEFS